VQRVEQFIAVPVGPAAVASAPADIRIELKRGHSTVSVTWPCSAAAECAVWLRELLR
jgi:transposase